MRAAIPYLLLAAVSLPMTGAPLAISVQPEPVRERATNLVLRFPSAERLFPPPRSWPSRYPSPWPLDGEAALDMLESRRLDRPPGFLGPYWGWALELRRRTGQDGRLLELLGRQGHPSRRPFRREELFIKGEALFHLERWREAADTLARFVRMYPGDTLALAASFGWAEAAYRAGRLDEASRAFGEISRRRPIDPTLVYQAERSLAWIHREAGDTLAALATLESLLASPQQRDTERALSLRCDLAELELARERPDRARLALLPWEEAARTTDAERSADAAHLDPRGFLLLGRAALEQEDWTAAEAAFDALPRTATPPPPEWIARAHAVLGWLCLRRGEVERAQAHYELSRDAGDARDLYGLALSHARQGEPARALALLDDWKGEIPPELAWSWSFARAFLLLQLDRPAEVVTALHEALSPDHPDSLRLHAFVLMGDARRRLGQDREALAAYRQAGSLVEDPPEDLLWRWALVSLARDQWGEASRVLEDLLRRHPGSQRRGEARFWQAEALYRLGRYSDSERSYEQAMRAGYPAAPALYGLGWCAYVSGDFARAAARFGEALERGLGSPQAADAALRRGHALSNLREWSAALDAYETAERLGKGTGLEGEARFREGRLLFKQGRLQEAARLFDDLSRTAPRPRLAARSIYWAGQAWFAAAAYDTAAQRMRSAQVRPDLSDSLRAAAVLGEADALYNLGRHDEAQVVYRRLLQMPAAPRAVRMAAADGIYNALVLQERWEDAERLLNDISRTFPDLARDVERHLRIADGFLEGGEAERAASAYRTLLEREDLTPVLRVRGWVGAARAHAQLEQWGRAALCYEQAGEHSDPGRRGALWIEAARLFLRSGEPRHAVRLLEEIRGRELEVPTPWETPWLLAQAYEASDRAGPAARIWTEAARSAPSDTLKAEAFCRAGRLRFEQEDWEGALAAFASADSLGAVSRPYRCTYWMGEALYRLERWDEAQQMLARFLEDPPEEAPWAALARLRRAATLEELERWNEAIAEYERVLDLPVSEALIEEARTRLREARAWRAGRREEGARGERPDMQ